jgi:hypothetical protein
LRPSALILLLSSGLAACGGLQTYDAAQPKDTGAPDVTEAADADADADGDADTDTDADVDTEGTSEPDTDPPDLDLVCDDSCLFSADGYCDDGGCGSDYDVCDFGSDCTDCGVRSLSGGFCGDGVVTDCEVCDGADLGGLSCASYGLTGTLSCLGSCDGYSTSSCGGVYTCDDTCTFYADGQCDDGGPDSDWSVCDLGTDCTDCGPWPR